VLAAGVGGGVAVAGAGAGVAGLSRNDIRILRFDLVLEYLQAGLYTEAEELGRVSAGTLEWARVVGAHERAHAAAIKGLLGPRNLVPRPTFNYGRITAEEKPFQKTAVAFEDLTSALLKWQAPRLDSRPVVAAVATLHSVETRHAAWIRRRVGLPPVTSAFDKPAAQEKMARLIASTHFIVSRPRMTAKTPPRFTG
jgi:Ferritin-like domain